MDKRAKISVVIPTYEMRGLGCEYLSRNLDSLANQVFTDFEVVISDNSDNDDIEKLCQDYKDLKITYFKNPLQGMAANTNEGMKAAKGKIIKILYQDDFLAHDQALGDIAYSFKASDKWLVTGCGHSDEFGEWTRPHYPEYTKGIKLGINTIGSPSVLAILNDEPLLFDESLTWVLDCDLYSRLYDTYGLPRVLNSINVIIGTGTHQTTHILTNEYKQSEQDKIYKRYAQNTSL